MTTIHWNVFVGIGLTVILVSLALMFSWKLVFGATEEECTLFRSDHVIQLQGSSNYLASCSWIVDRLLYNGSGFEVKSFDWEDGYYSDDQYVWILTKK